MFSMCSELTPRARIPDTRIPQLMQPCMWKGRFLKKKRNIFFTKPTPRMKTFNEIFKQSVENQNSPTVPLVQKFFFYRFITIFIFWTALCQPITTIYQPVPPASTVLPCYFEMASLTSSCRNALNCPLTSFETFPLLLRFIKFIVPVLIFF